LAAEQIFTPLEKGGRSCEKIIKRGGIFWALLGGHRHWYCIWFGFE